MQQRTSNKKTKSLTILVRTNNNGFAGWSRSYLRRGRHCDAVVNKLFQTRQSHLTIWKIDCCTVTMILCQWVIGDVVTCDDTILFSRWNIIPNDKDAGWACVMSAHIHRSSRRFWNIWVKIGYFPRQRHLASIEGTAKTNHVQRQGANSTTHSFSTSGEI